MNGSQFIEAGTSNDFSLNHQLFTIEYWIKPASMGSEFTPVWRGLWATSGWYTDVKTDGSSVFYMQENGGVWPCSAASGTVTTGNWQHYVFVRTGSGDSSVITQYKNGSQIASCGVHAGTDASGLTMDIGAYNGGANFNGSIDEIRISTGIARPAAWIQTEYNNQNNPAGFISVGSQQGYSSGGTNYVTNYTYDMLNHLIGVSMTRGTTTQTRTFNYVN